MVSVITAHFPGREGLLLETYASLEKQKIEWEWLIQVDGKSESVPEQIRSDHRVKIQINGRLLTQAITRNLGLARARGEWVYSLDDDDMVLPDAFENFIQGMEKNPDIPCGLGKSYKLTDGELLEWASYGTSMAESYTPGRIPQGQIIDIWLQEGSHHLPSTALFWRKEALLRLGGWPGFFGSDDTVLLLRANLQSDILLIESDTFIHRIHSQQTTHEETYQNLRLKNRNLFIEELRARGYPVPDSIKN